MLVPNITDQWTRETDSVWRVFGYNTMTSYWARWRLKSPGSLVFTQPLIQGAGQKKHQSSASLAFVRGIHRWPVNSPHKRPVTPNKFHLMTSSWIDSETTIQKSQIVTEIWHLHDLTKHQQAHLWSTGGPSTAFGWDAPNKYHILNLSHGISNALIYWQHPLINSVNMDIFQKVRNNTWTQRTRLSTR